MLFQFAILFSCVLINEGLKACSNASEPTKSPNCILTSTSLTTWQNAHEFCEQLGGDLVSIVSDEEQQSLSQLLSTTINDSIGFWIGLSDVNSPGILEWADKSIFNYSQIVQIPVWSLENEGNCLYLNSQMEWTNDNCSSQKGFICNEKSQSFNNNSGCEHGKQRFRDSCYWMVDSSQNGWIEAENWCMTEGGHLATIIDELENLFISSILMKGDEAVWIGLQKTSTSDVPTWITNQSLNYSNWESSPNLSSELCGMIDKNGLWIMQPCSSQHKAAVCEGPLSTDTTSEISEPASTSLATFDFSVHCPLGWEQINNRCYMIEKSTMPWDEALTHCYSLGGDIASFSSSEDERVFFLLINNILTINDIQFFWIGLKCSNYTPALSWVDRTPLLYDEQDFEQVHNMKNEHPELDLCIAHSMETYRWMCLPCGSPFGSVCSMILTHQEEVTPLNPINSSPESIANSTTQPSLWHGDDCIGKESDLCRRSPASTDLCPEAWVKLGQKCYKIEKDPTDWTSAKKNCTNLGDDFNLVSIHSSAELEFINEIKSMSGISVVWIGLNDKSIETAFDWSDGSPVNFSKLRIGPQRKHFQRILDCVATKNDNEWTARECGTSLPYICQKVLVSQESPAILAEPSTLHDYSNQPNTEETTAEYATDDYSSQSHTDLPIDFNTTDAELSTTTYQSVEVTTLMPDFSSERETETIFATTVYYETESEFYNMTSENSEISPTAEGTQFSNIEPITENDYLYTDADPDNYADEPPNSSEDTVNDSSNSLDTYEYDMANVGMSGGTITAIVFGCLILTCLIVGGVIYFYSRAVPVPLLKDKYCFDNALYNPNGDDIQLQPDSIEI